MVRRCKICHSASNLDETGRCSSCADAKRARQMGIHYGEYMARKEIGALPEMPRRKRFEAAEKRARQIMELGFLPFAMLYRDETGKRDPEWMKFQREWANAVIVGRKFADYWKK